MAFEDFEESAHAGEPVQIFKFVYGPEAGEYYAYTDHTDPLVIDGITYEPVAIERSEINSDGTLDKSALKISTDIGTEIAELFRVYPPANVVTLILRAGHVGDLDEEFLVIWAGRIVACSRDGSEAVMHGEPVSTSLRRPGLRRHYQYGCPHQLYGPHCLANKAAATVASTVASLAGATVTLNSGWNGAFAADKFLGGMLEGLCGGRRRLPAPPQQHPALRRPALDPDEEPDRHEQHVLLRQANGILGSHCGSSCGGRPDRLVDAARQDSEAGDGEGSR
jgi:hypothetical protein